ncbi:MAG TPA: tetratricopeptide repeat protein [Stellaceae bacterium]|nr:tetratricopeptide repeat protein [Stellaceae bacterium]
MTDPALARGLELHKAGRLEEAEAIYRVVLARDPANAQAQNGLAVIAGMRGDFAGAAALFRAAAERAPDNANIAYNLGEALRKAGDLSGSIAAFARAIELQPDMADAHYRLALNLEATGDLDLAEAAYRKTLALDPQNALALVNFAAMLFSRRRTEEAIGLLQRAIEAAPDLAEAYCNLGIALQEQDRWAEAIAALKRAVALKPDDALALSHLMLLQQSLCDWTGFAELRSRVVAGVRQRQPVNVFNLLFISDDPSLHLEAAQRQASALRVPPSRGFVHRPSNHGTRLRIGYLSPEFRNHALAHLAAEFFERHDRERFETVGFSIGPDRDDAMRRRLKAAFDRFIDLDPLSDTAAAERIQAEDIAILVDLAGYTTNARTAILALRPAPIQVNYLGYPGTMGASFIDYIIVDRFIAPASEQPFYTEKLVHLPNCYQVTDTTRRASGLPSRVECGLPAQGFVFCCFNNPYKIVPAIFAVWMRLLAAVPASVLWLLEGKGASVVNLRREAMKHGVDPERLVFAPKQPMPQHLSRYRHADLFLDTLPCNAHTTASDALWSGVPLLTCTGRSFASRVAGSILCAVGLPELVTSSVAQYEATALRLARSPDELAGLRRRLADAPTRSTLFDTARQTRAIEAAFAEMWRLYTAGESSRAFAVETA